MDEKQIILGVLFTTLLLLLLVAGIFISIYIAGKHRMQQEIKITQMELSFEKEMRKAETEVSEHVMKQVADELHDNISHILTCMRITIENKKLDDPEKATSYQPIEGYLNEAYDQVKLLSRSLNTDYVNNIGLHEAVRLEINRINKLKRHTIHWKEHEMISLDNNTELLVFRIFQEIMQNAIKHSKAKNIYIRMEQDHGFTLDIRDDGIGFDFESTVSTSKTSGLKNIMKRAKMAGMDCTIESAAGTGCRYTLQQSALQ